MLSGTEMSRSKCKTCGYEWITGDGGHDCWSVVKGERDALREAIVATVVDIEQWTTRRGLGVRLKVLHQLLREIK